MLPQLRVGPLVLFKPLPFHGLLTVQAAVARHLALLRVKQLGQRAVPPTSVYVRLRGGQDGLQLRCRRRRQAAGLQPRDTGQRAEVEGRSMGAVLACWHQARASGVVVRPQTELLRQTRLRGFAIRVVAAGLLGYHRLRWRTTSRGGSQGQALRPEVPRNGSLL